MTSGWGCRWWRLTHLSVSVAIYLNKVIMSPFHTVCVSLTVTVAMVITEHGYSPSSLVLFNCSQWCSWRCKGPTYIHNKHMRLQLHRHLARFPSSNRSRAEREVPLQRVDIYRQRQHTGNAIVRKIRGMLLLVHIRPTHTHTAHQSRKSAFSRKSGFRGQWQAGLHPWRHMLSLSVLVTQRVSTKCCHYYYYYTITRQLAHIWVSGYLNVFSPRVKPRIG